jgi:hypothetical protein
LHRAEDGIRRVVVLSDGHANVGISDPHAWEVTDVVVRLLDELVEQGKVGPCT